MTKPPRKVEAVPRPATTLPEQEDAPTRMSEPDGDLLAILQRARAVDDAQPGAPRSRRAKVNAVSTQPNDDDAPTLVRTDISVEVLEERAAEAAPPENVPLGVPPREMAASSARRTPRASRYWAVALVVIVAGVFVVLWLSAPR